MSITTLEELFHHDLRDIYDAEKQLLKGLRRLSKKGTSEDLQTAFEDHAAVTETQIERLEHVFEILGKPVRGKHCSGMEGLVKEGTELMEEELPGVMLDAALIGAAQKIEHYEIAAYGTLIANAERLGIRNAVALLEETLSEEKETDELLTSIASELLLEADEDAEKVEVASRGRRSRK